MAQALPANCCGAPSCNATTIDWETTDLSGWFKVADLTELYAIAADSGNQFATVGTAAAFIGQYHWDPSNTDPDDGFTVINPTGNLAPGRWVKVI